MAQTTTFSRGKLADFLDCQRRYQLRYERRLAWPVGPLETRTAGALERGRRFHQLLQRHFLSLTPAEPAEDEPELSRWWRLFQSQGPRLPAGRRLPEFSLTVPIGRHFLTGRYDLLIIGEDDLFIYDWKTGTRPPAPDVLRDDLQTRVYLALAAEGAPALWRDLRPEAIRLTYWYTSDPPETRSLVYDAAWHEENWAGLLAVVEEIQGRLEAGGDLPLTDDLAQCRRCAYQVYCGRQAGGMELAEWYADETSAADATPVTDELLAGDTASLRLEPDRP
jgi:hypothetical protein